MQIKSEFTQGNNQQISFTFQKIISALFVDVVLHSGSFETRKKLVETYCKIENLSYAELENNLSLFFELLEDYRETNNPVFYRFLKLQAKSCFFDEHDFDLLIKPANDLERGLEVWTQNNATPTSCDNSSSDLGEIVGGHLIGL
jgi:hypothetical protein